MKSREVQAKNLAKKIISYNMPVTILGKSYKPDVNYSDGSYSILVAYYIKELSNLEIGFDDNWTDVPCTYLLAHRRKFHDFNFIQGSVVIDPWREFKRTDSIHCETLKEVVYYGNTNDN